MYGYLIIDIVGGGGLYSSMNNSINNAYFFFFNCPYINDKIGTGEP